LRFHPTLPHRINGAILDGRFLRSYDRPRAASKEAGEATGARAARHRFAPQHEALGNDYEKALGARIDPRQSRRLGAPAAR